MVGLSFGSDNLGRIMENTCPSVREKYYHKNITKTKGSLPKLG